MGRALDETVKFITYVLLPLAAFGAVALVLGITDAIIWAVHHVRIQ